MSKKISAYINPWPWCKRHGWKVLLIGLAALMAYSVYLDANIQKRFNGNKWQVPAQIYARPLTLTLKQEITEKEIVEELELLGYRNVSLARKSGEYAINGNHISIRRRAFTFADGDEPEEFLQVSLENNRVTSIADLARNQAQNSMRLEPWLVTRLSAGSEDRMLVTLDDIPKPLIDALVTVEDQEFYHHFGINPFAIARAAVANIIAGRTVQGGSTLTQQLVKNMYLSREKSLWRKVKEALMALIIEFRYSKEEILQAYLNEVFLGQNGALAVHGVGLASYFYFDRPVNELNLAEMATLVAIIKGPSYYNPRRYAERVLERRNLVLRMLFEANKLDRQSYELYVNMPLDIASGASLAQGKHPAYMDKIRRELRQILTNPQVLESGIKVFSTLDPVAQRRAEDALVAQTERIGTGLKIQDLQGAMVITDIASGEIRALVGDCHPAYQGFNRALDASRSIGSLVKPAVYLTALEQPYYYNLATMLKDEPIKLKSTYGKLWEPKNYDKTFRGQVPLITALTHSLNVPTVNLGMTVGLSNVADTLHRLGVESDVPEFPALTLGAVNMTPIEVNQMYQTIANNGMYEHLHAVNAVVDSNDHVIWRYQQPGEQRVDEQATYLLNYALHKVTLDGTAKSIKKLFPNVNMAGKTGTTDDYRDSWFSGFDKNMVITAWLGKDDNSSVMLSGAGGAMRVFIDYQQHQQPKSLVRRFPEGLGIAHFDENSGLLTKAGCQHSMSLPAILDALPQDQVGCNGQPASVPKPATEKKSFWDKWFGD